MSVFLCSQSVFGDKLVKKFLFESDCLEDPQLPSPNQLKYKILIKNKKLRSQQQTPSLVKQKVNLLVNITFCTLSVVLFVLTQSAMEIAGSQIILIGSQKILKQVCRKY